MKKYDPITPSANMGARAKVCSERAPAVITTDLAPLGPTGSNLPMVRRPCGVRREGGVG